ncbi:hypothetical protein T265_06313 [Opisthorchis viverrini]|uniref:D-glucuronyl C5-epimerase C-terminal domain-containing protein n=1 Tax=Opisthorchis viverrini TaxID=6198 RepID=A0A074ZSU8_OPIVI|nr:hypothetical protein T265_06313 [Opisthorchis viverrini]KER26460.1 hypothetical protein T265_06313 [Opisthorchis viverrini]
MSCEFKLTILPLVAGGVDRSLSTAAAGVRAWTPTMHLSAVTFHLNFSVCSCAQFPQVLRSSPTQKSNELTRIGSSVAHRPLRCRMLTACGSAGGPAIDSCWLQLELNPTHHPPPRKTELGQPDSIPALVLPLGGMTARHRKDVTAEGPQSGKLNLLLLRVGFGAKEHDWFLAGNANLMYKYVRPRNFYYGLLIGLGLFMLSVLNNRISRHADPPNGVIRSPLVDDEVAFMYAETLSDDHTNHSPDPFDPRGQESIKLACTLEQTVLPACYLLNNTDIYVPLRSIETAFELVSTVNLQAKTVTVRQTSVSIPLSRPDNHDVTGSYMFFDQYDVEKRHHVKLVLADEGIPLSTQWSQRAYPYPIQIAQFGLSHYSKWATLTQKRTHNTGTSASPGAVTDVDLLDSRDPHFVRSLHLSLDDRPTVYRFSVGASSESLLAFDARAADTKLIHSRWRYFVLSGDDWHEGSYVKLRVLRAASDPSSWKEIVYACGNASPLQSKVLTLNFAESSSTCAQSHPWGSSGKRSPRVPFNLTFCLGINCTRSVKYTDLHANWVLAGDSTEPRPNLLVMIFLNRNAAKRLSLVSVGTLLEISQHIFSRLIAHEIAYVCGLNPTSASRLHSPRLGQPGSTPAVVLPWGGVAARHRRGVTAERLLLCLNDLQYRLNLRVTFCVICKRFSDNPFGALKKLQRIRLMEIMMGGSKMVHLSPERSSVSIELARDLLRDLQKVFGQSFWRFEKTSAHSFNGDNDGWIEDGSSESSTVPTLTYSAFTVSHLPSHSRLIHVELVELYAGVHGPDGGGLIRLMRLGRPSSTESPGLTEILFHTSRFISAAKWFLRNQGSDGGWHIPVARQFRERPTIEPGWVSAMGQGQGISLLVRVYNYTKDMTYLESAHRALGPFARSVAQGGVLSYFLGQLAFPWFEEYPTRPGSHVLNGMIYSLVGLYDLSQVSPLPEVRKRSTQLWHSGLNSLSTLLPLFDSGSGSFYDLRHVTPATGDIKTSMLIPESSFEGRFIHRGPNRARWSYHALHIRQLRLLASIDNDHAVQWSDTASRWTSGVASPFDFKGRVRCGKIAWQLRLADPDVGLIYQNRLLESLPTAPPLDVKSYWDGIVTSAYC